MKKGPATYLFAFLLNAAVFLPGVGWGQVNISPGSTISETFTIGTSSTATLPQGWKIDKINAVRTLGAYSAAQTTTDHRAGDNMSSSASNGIYNFGAGDPSTAIDRAIGGISSGGGSQSINIYSRLYNSGASSIGSLTISYNVEKYRNGSNSAGFSIQLFYSYDGLAWTNAGAEFLISFSADSDNSGFTSAPGETKNVIEKNLNQKLSPGESLFLAWNYSVTSGTTTTNAQALGIDDVVITANHPPTEIILSHNELTGFGYQDCFPTSKTYTITGYNLELDGEITINASNTNFELSTDDFTFQEKLTIPYEGIELAPNPIFIRLKENLPFGFYENEIILHSGGGAETVELRCSGYPMNYINFEDQAKWIQGSEALTSYQNDHQYVDGVFSATGGPALRETSGTQDGFPRTIGDYAWRLRDVSNVEWTIIIASGGVGGFSLDIRRWDDSPSPNFNFEYSINNGATWILISTINNESLDNTSDWKTFYGLINSGQNNIKIRLKANGATERIMVDNFFWTCFFEPICSTTDYFFTTANHGDWSDPETWLASFDKSTWLTPDCPPDYRAKEIIIQTNHKVTITQSVVLSNTIIKTGGILQRNPGNHIIALFDGTGDDLIIEGGGTFRFQNSSSRVNYNSSITYLDNSKILVKTGGMLEVQISAGSGFSSFGLEPITRIEYQNNAVFYWNAQGALSLASANATYFPNVSIETVPILRIGNSFSMGAGTPTIINGVLSVDEGRNITFQNAGTKTFRNGITGTGKVTQTATSGAFVINGTEAKLDIAQLELRGNLSISPTTNIVSGSTNLSLTGTSSQTFTLPSPNPHPVRFANITVNNPAGVSINQDFQIRNTLTMQSGNIFNEGKTITVGESATNVGNVVHNGGAIHGKLRRWIPSTVTEDLVFPIGKPELNTTAWIKFTEEPTGGSITSEFIADLPINYYAGLPLMADGVTVNNLADEGFWRINAENGLSGGTFSLTLSGSDIDTIKKPDDIRVLKRSTNYDPFDFENEWFGLDDLYFFEIDGKYFFTVSNQNNFSEFTLGGYYPENPLPIELLSFTAEYQNGKVLLNWATGSEINNDYFSLERSSDAVSAEIIGFMEGAGNSSLTLHYEFVDHDPLPGISYYRLKQNDYDGSFEYSQWVAVQVDGIGVRLQALAISQPQRLLLRIFTPTERPLQIQLADIYGRIVHSEQLSPGSPGQIETFVPMPQAASSVLLYRITDGLDVVTGKVVR